MTQDNKSLIMGLLKDNYSVQISDHNFPFTLSSIMENINRQRAEFSGLMDMNKTLLMECAQLFNKKNPRDIFDMRLREKTAEFNMMANSKPPSEIDFTDTKHYDPKEGVDTLLSRQLKERETDTTLFMVKGAQKKQNAQDWINNEVPPRLNIVEESADNIFIQPLQPKKVTFKTPLEETTTPTNTLFSKLKRSNTTEKKSFCIRPNEIQGNKLFFERNFGLVKKIAISKLFLKDVTQRITNPLQQEICLLLSAEPFLVFTLVINGTFRKENLLFVKKNYDGTTIYYETDEEVIINEPIKRIELHLFDKDDTGVIIPLRPQITAINGKNLITTNNHNFKDSKFTYLVMEDDLLYPGELITNDNIALKIMGTCQIEYKNNKYNLKDIHDVTKHNAAIVAEESDRYQFRHLSRLPILHFSIIT